MASVKLNPVLDSVRGKIGDLVFKKFGDETIVARAPDTKDRESSPAQKAVQDKFRQAAGYGKIVMADPQARAAYEVAAKKDRQPLFSLMMQDFLNDPTIDEVDLTGYNHQTGDTIAIRASDDFDVVAVEVGISNATTNEAIERGSAMKSTVEIGRWVYTATASVANGTPLKIDVTASDRPGHKTTRTETK